MISITAAVNVLVWLVVAGVIFFLLQWALARIDPPQPFRKVAEAVLVVLAVLMIVGVLLSFVTGTPIFRP